MKTLDLLKVKYIVVHCTASVEGRDLSVADIRRDHKSRGFEDIGYHYVIRRDGLIEEGRSQSYQGAHVKGYNGVSIGVCYVGGLDVNGKPKDTRTPQQKKWMKYLLRSLKTQLKNKVKIVGHRDLSPDLNGNGIVEPSEWIKVCPCFDVEKEYNDKDLWTAKDMDYEEY